MFVCSFWVYRPTRFSLIWRRHHYRWRAPNFDLCSALMAIEQWGFFGVPHLLWHGASVYDGHLRGPVTLAPTTELLAVELCWRLGFEHPTFCLRGQRSYPGRKYIIFFKSFSLLLIIDQSNLSIKLWWPREGLQKLYILWPLRFMFLWWVVGIQVIHWKCINLVLYSLAYIRPTEQNFITLKVGSSLKFYSLLFCIL